MTQIINEGGKTIIKTGERIDTMNAPQFEQDIQPALADGGPCVLSCSRRVSSR